MPSADEIQQFLTAVPAAKLFAFGGDYRMAELSYAHLELARREITRALSELVADDYLGVSEAEQIARAILRENALGFFRVEQKRVALAKALARDERKAPRAPETVGGQGASA